MGFPAIGFTTPDFRHLKLAAGFIQEWTAPRTVKKGMIFFLDSTKTRWWFEGFFMFHPYLGKIPILTFFHIFSRGVETRNHQLVLQDSILKRTTKKE